MSRPRNCRHCTWMCCGDANWCSEHEEVMSDGQVQAARACHEFEWNSIDALTLEEWTPKPPRKRAVSDGQMMIEVDA